MALTALATTVTGFTLGVFGPPDVGRPVPALLLLGRDAALLALVAVAVGVGWSSRSGADSVQGRRLREPAMDA